MFTYDFIISRKTASVVPNDWEKECRNKKSNTSKLFYVFVCITIDFLFYLQRKTMRKFLSFQLWEEHLPSS